MWSKNYDFDWVLIHDPTIKIGMAGVIFLFNRNFRWHLHTTHIFFTSIYACDKRCTRKVFKETFKFGIEHPGIVAQMTKQTMAHVMRYICMMRTTLLMTSSINSHQDYPTMWNAEVLWTETVFKDNSFTH